MFTEYLTLRREYVSSCGNVGSASAARNRVGQPWNLTTYQDAHANYLAAINAANAAAHALTDWENAHTPEELADAEAAYWDAMYAIPTGAR